MKNSFMLQIAALCFATLVAYGAVPQAITYQGFLTDDAGAPVSDGDYSLTFRIYDAASGGTSVWSEIQPSITVVNGLFKAQLGSITPIAAAFDAPYWLEVQVGSGSPQTPRIELSAVPYSFMAIDAEQVGGYEVNPTPTANTLLPLDATGKFPESAIPAVPVGGTAGGDLTGTYPNPTIAANAVNSAKIADSAVNTSDIADAAVTQAKLAPNVTLPPGGVAGGDLTGTYPNPTIAANAVTSAKIQDGQVNTADIHDDAVTAAKIAPNVVSSLDGVSNDGGNIDLVAGANITITPNDGANTITIAASGGGGSGDITGVSAGQGLTGGGTSGDVTLNVGAGTGIAVTADAVALSSGYADGSVHDARFVNEAQNNSVTSAMIVDGTIQQADMGFAAGDITAVNAGTGLDGGGTSGSVTLSVEVPLALTGTVTAGPLAVVKAENTTTVGPFHGVFGECASTDGFGVTGAATATNGETIGVNGYANSPLGHGVHGWSPSCGVYGEASATTANGGTGGRFKSMASDGSGIYAENLHASGNTVGVSGYVASSQGIGVYGLAGSASGTTYGAYGETYSPSGVGVYGTYGGVTNADAIGVRGYSAPAHYFGIGVKGEGGYRGVWGTVDVSDAGSHSYHGVYGYGRITNDTGTVVGVYGNATGGATHYGVYYSGGLGGTSLMKNIVRTDDGPVALYGHFTTENWFEDFGSGEITGGRAVVRLADDFAKVSSRSSAAELKVFITPNARMGEWWVEKTSLGFTLHAPDAANGSSFDYRVVTKRPGSENLRLEAAPEGYADRALYTDVSEVPAQYHAEWAKQAAVQAQNTDPR